MKLKYIGTGIVFLVVVVIALSGCVQNEQNISPNTVIIQNFAFNPNTLTVPVGTTVTWTNKDSAVHNVISDTGAFGSENLNQGNSYSFTFTQAGDYPYTCTIHPSMKGAVTVKS
jgi:plastocyanin